MTDIDSFPIGRGPTGRRSFPLAFRIEVLRRWDGYTEHGAKTRLLRELNLSKNHVTAFELCRGSPSTRTRTHLRSHRR